MSTVSLIRIMLVDDHETLRRSIKLSLLAYDDFQLVGEAANGAEAVRLCAQVLPDVILMDLSMPEMDGVTATALIRQRWPEVKIVILTSFNDELLVKAALKAGADSYIFKDFTIDRLANLIRATGNHSNQNQSGQNNNRESVHVKLSGNNTKANHD